LVLLALSCFVPGVSTIEENEVDYEKTFQEYRNDWSVHPDNPKNSTETYGSVVQNEGSDVTVNHQGFEPIGGPMDSAWPMQGQNIHHTCLSPYSTATNQGTEMWRVSGDYRGEVESSAVIDKNGTIYFGTRGSDQTLYALYPNGTRKWKFHSYGSIWGTPALAENGDIYCTKWGDSYLVAVTKNGVERWRFDQESSSASSPTIGADGTIYFGTDDNNIFAIFPNGTEKWRYATGDNVVGSPAIDNDGIIYIGSLDNYLYALNPNGTLIWRFNAYSDIKGDASIAEDGTIYVPAFNSYFYALNPNGTLRWQAFTGDSIAAAGVALAPDGTIYVGTEQLRAYYPNGTLKWITNLQGDIYGTVPAISADGTIYVSAGCDLVAVNPDGTERWRCTIADTWTRSSPSIGADGTVYVGSTWGGFMSYGYLHAFGSGEPKTIEIQNPVAGHWYFLGQDKGLTRKNNTVILGSVPVKTTVYSPDELESLHFYVDGTEQYNITAPPFEWNMNRRYGNLFPLQHTITVTGFYKGGTSWSESINVLYFHLFNK
jgi:outer membrane protein assembly factor BamB